MSEALKVRAATHGCRSNCWTSTAFSSVFFMSNFVVLQSSVAELEALSI